MKKLYFYETNVGVFYIAEQDERFHLLFEDESLRSYSTAQEAVDELAHGQTFTLANGIDTSLLDFPGELSEWEQCRELP